MPRLNKWEVACLKRTSEFGTPEFLKALLPDQAEAIFAADEDYLRKLPSAILTVLGTILIRAQFCDCQCEFDELTETWFRIAARPHREDCFRTTIPVQQDWGEKRVRTDKYRHVRQSPEMMSRLEHSFASPPRKPKRMPDYDGTYGPSTYRNLYNLTQRQRLEIGA